MNHFEKKLPVGIENFEKIRTEGFYYIDKTGMIVDLLQKWGEVNLFTRPRRFGKSLNMSMLRAFFEIGGNREIFDGLRIAEETTLCEQYMVRFPVISISLKDVEGDDFAAARSMLCSVIGSEALRFQFLTGSGRLTENEKEMYRQLTVIDGGSDGVFAMSEAVLTASLKTLSMLLHKHYDSRVIILIDEYDVPLAKANEKGYYEQMVTLLRKMFGNVLKTNDHLYFAVLTGCLRIAKESIFTGLNNMKVMTISDVQYDEYFGFTDEEVRALLRYYEMSDAYDIMKEWYDGYHFGDFDIYCPWDVMNHVERLMLDPKAQPVGYWKNSSDNAIIRLFIDLAGDTVTKKLESLLSGGYVVQRVEEDLTYQDLLSSEENLWSMLYLTGYLTRIREDEIRTLLPEGCFALGIPNREIKEIFETTISRWFQESTPKWDRRALFDAVWSGDYRTVTKEMTKLLRRTISYHDYREDFYHAFFAGIFAGAGYAVESNREHGEGRSDVIVQDYPGDRIAIFEVKYAKSQESMEKSCEEAVAQINSRMYGEEFQDDFSEVLYYGISFYKKRCLVRRRESEPADLQAE